MTTDSFKTTFNNLSILDFSGHSLELAFSQLIEILQTVILAKALSFRVHCVFGSLWIFGPLSIIFVEI